VDLIAAQPEFGGGRNRAVFASTFSGPIVRTDNLAASLCRIIFVRQPLLAGATVMRVISKAIEIERNRLDRSARRVEKSTRRAATGHRCRIFRAAVGVRTRPTYALAGNA